MACSFVCSDGAVAKVTLLHEFAGGPADGGYPLASLTVVGSRLFGTTQLGGARGLGTLFSSDLDGANYQVMRHFREGASDGGRPAGGVVFNGSTLYGTTSMGGPGQLGLGTLYSINPDGSDYQVLRFFEGFHSNLTTNDGAFPNGDLILDGKILYGTTSIGRAGNLYAFDTEQNLSRSLHLFDANQAGAPRSPLVLAGSTLYGVNSAGGASDRGVIFAINADAPGYQVLHSFSGGDDGRSPGGGLALRNSRLYGTTTNGGALNRGVLFSIGIDGSQFQVLHEFGAGTDGRGPEASLTFSGSTLYGTTVHGGKDGRGTVFSMNADGSGYRLLHEFAGGPGDGASPRAAMTVFGSKLYGTTAGGGDNDQGTLFVIAIPEPSTTFLGWLGFAPFALRRRSSRKRSLPISQHPLRVELLERREMLDAGWVSALGGAGSDRLWDLAGDAAGNTYIVGEFSGTTNLGGKLLTSAGGGDIFVAKLNSSGQVQWAARAGGSSGSDLGYSVTVDAKGAVFVTGHFTGTAKFGKTTLVSAGPTDAFVAKLAGNNGSFQWAQKISGSGMDRGLAVEIDGGGNVLVSGGLNGATFVYADGINTRYGATQVFVAKYNTNGKQLWNRTVAGTYDQATLEGMALDSAGGVYVAGAFAGTMNFPVGSLTSASATRDIVIAKLNSSGVWQWADSVSPTIDGDVRGAALRGGKLYVAGAFEGTLTLDAQALTSAGVNDGFVGSFDTATRSFDWAQRFGGTDLDIAREVAVDAQGNIHVVGSYRGTADFGSFELVNSTPAGTTFVTMLSPGGAFMEALSLGGPGSNSARNIAFDGLGNRYVGGYFEGQAEFAQGTLTSAGGIDSYVTRLASPSQPLVATGVAGTYQSESREIDAVFVDYFARDLAGSFL